MMRRKMEVSHNDLLIFGILFGILRYTSALACADVEYSIEVKLVPKTLSYQQAVSNCEANGKELCSSKTICEDGKTPYGGVIPGDNWTPVTDSSNEWIQVGNGHRPCTIHSHLGTKPAWGLKNSVENYKGTLFCCEIRRKENSISIKAVSNRVSYQQAAANCKADGKELCTSKEICEDGKTPNSGPIPGDHWIPVKDSLNEWLQIGNSPHRPCILHSTLGAKPFWGVVNSAQRFKGNLFCCKIKQKDDGNGITIKTVPNTISYPQALASCQADTKELCTSHDICKDGKTPNSGPFSGDNWVPVKDSLNEWLQIGNSPHRPCLLHSKLGSKPTWGLTNAAHIFKGKLFCCEKKRPESRIFLKSVAKTTTYNQGVSTCKSDGQHLCNSNEICKNGGVPVSGEIPGDHWVPVKNAYNEWVQIGNSPHKPCILHTQLGSKPSWGVTTVKYNFKGYLFCCKN